MIGYVTLGTSDLQRAGAFYDELLGMIEAKRIFDMDRLIGWSTAKGQPTLVVCKPYDKNEATVGNGVMVALVVGTTELVDAMHKKALELGGTDEGAPGPRANAGAYCGYLRDLDGNKLNIACYGAS